MYESCLFIYVSKKKDFFPTIPLQFNLSLFKILREDRITRLPDATFNSSRKLGKIEHLINYDRYMAQKFAFEHFRRYFP